MNDSSPYKSCFVSILFILLVVVVALVISISMSGCSTKKSLSSEATETAQAVTVASQDLAAVEHQRLDRTITITLDDLELLMDADAVFPLDDVALIQGKDSATCSPAPLQMRNARRAPLRLKARQAVISSATNTDYKSELVAHNQDSTTAKSSSEQQVQQSGEVTAVAHPVPPWIYLLLAVAMVGFLIYRYKH